MNPDSTGRGGFKSELKSMQSDPHVKGVYEMHGSTVSQPSRQETKTVRHFEDGKGS